MLVVLDVFSIVALCIYCTFLAYAIIVTLIFGENNLNKMPMTGPYEVGFRMVHTSKEGLEVSVYYPMDREEYAREIVKPGKNTPWL